MNHSCHSKQIHQGPLNYSMIVKDYLLGEFKTGAANKDAHAWSCENVAPKNQEIEWMNTQNQIWHKITCTVPENRC